jgi:Flp pilus assembly protein TadD
VLVRSGQMGEADKLARSWIEENPKDFNFRLYLASLYRTNKDYPRALQEYKEEHELQPKNAAVLNNMAFVAADLRDPAALQYAEKAYSLAPSRPEIMDTYGDLLVRNGQVDRGLEILRKASAAAPQASDIRLNLARALVKAGRKDEARKELDQLSKLGGAFGQQAEVAQLLKTL